MITSEIRKQARESLTGKWGKGALITLVYLIISMILSWILGLIPVIGSIILLVLEVPLAYGIIASFMRLKRGEDVSLTNFVTEGMAKFKKSWTVSLYTILKVIVPFIIVIVCYILMFVGVAQNIRNPFGTLVTQTSISTRRSNTVFNSGRDIDISNITGISTGEDNSILDSVGNIKSSSVAFILIGSIGSIVATIWLYVKSLSYSLSMFILKDNNELSSKEIVEKSAELMKGNRWKFVWLSITFIGWIILAGLTLGIGLLWLIPYIYVAQVVFYEDRLSA